MYLEIFLGEFRGISRKYLNFAGPRPREISEALTMPFPYKNSASHGVNTLLFKFPTISVKNLPRF